MLSLNEQLWTSETVQADDYLYANSCCLLIWVSAD